MSRSSSGTYSLPAGQPVVTGTTISASTFNTLTNDIATEITDSLSRSGKGGMSAVLVLTNGATVGAPDLTFAGDTNTGVYSTGADKFAIACGGVKQLELTTSAATIVQALTCSAGVTVTGGAVSLTVGTSNTGATIVGNRSAADSGTDLVINTVATRTAGNLVDVQTNGTSVLKVDFAGQIKWPSGPASTSTTPAPSAATSITPDTNFTASSGLAYWKDPMNRVHIKGVITNTAAGSKASMVSGANALPAGFRPAAIRGFAVLEATGGTVTHTITISTTGVIGIAPNCTTGEQYFLDNISYLAEA